MKILQVAGISNRPNGISVYAAALTRALAKSGACEVGLLPILPGVGPDKSAAIPGCVTLDPPLRNHYNPWSIGDYWLDTIEERFGKPDLVHFHGVYVPFETALARKLVKRGWPYIVSPHGGLGRLRQERKRWKKLIGNRLFFDAFIRSAAAVHASQEEEERSIQGRYPGVRTFVLANAVPADVISEWEALRAKQPSPSISRPLTVGFVGRLAVHTKGIDLLLTALRLLEEDCPEVDVRLILVGSYFTRQDETSIRELVACLKNPERVSVVGPLPEKEKWEALAGFDLFIHTSRYEGMPAAVLEAMAFRKPCILTPGTNLQDVLRTCDGGWACEDSPEAIKEALRAAYECRADLPRRGENAQRFILEHLTWDVLVKEYLSIVRTIV